ncbi:MAG: 50S ribosomal protein L4 [Chloroflexota bacterium]
MPEVQVYDADGAAAETIALNDDVFGQKPNTALLHQAVVRQLANARQGTHDTQTRGEVSRTTRKAYRQKGTGRARQGSRKAPHWTGGGVVFGPHPRSHRQDMPKKMRVGALRSALAAKAAAGEVVVLRDLTMAAPSTKSLIQLLAKVVTGRSLLLVLDAPQRAVQLSARNLPNVRTITIDNINVVDILRYEKLVLSLAALRHLEERYGRQTDRAQGATFTGADAETAAGATQEEGATQATPASPLSVTGAEAGTADGGAAAGATGATGPAGAEG